VPFSDVTVVIPAGCSEQKGESGVVKECRSVQEYFDAVRFDLPEDEVSFVFLRGLYSAKRQSMTAAAVLVNGYEQALLGIRCTVQLFFRDQDAEIAEVRCDLTPDFTGRLEPGEGLLFHLVIPVRGIGEDAMFSSSDICGELADVVVLYDRVNGIGLGE